VLRGKAVLPSDAGWDEARRAWNQHVDQRPAAVVFPETADDVVAVVLFARKMGRRIAPQGTGHNAGVLRGLEDAILLRTDRMRRVEVDAGARIARIEAGVLSGELQGAAARHGLAALSGTSPGVGVVGYTLGGGVGVLGRCFGLTANHVRAIELVTASGMLVRADREHHPELFWALRGGGGSFGVVTAMEVELLPHSQAYAGTLWYPRDRCREVLSAWRELVVANPPDELTTMGRVMSFPPSPEAPEAVRGKSFAVVHVYHLGDRSQADRWLAPLRALRPSNDTVRLVPVTALPEVHMDPDKPVPVVGDGWMLADLPSEALAALIDVASRSSLLATVEVRHLEGALARSRPENGALACLSAKHAVYAAGFGPTPQLVASVSGQLETVARALAPWTTPWMLSTFAETPRPPECFWTQPVYQRLRRIKGAVDPTNLILANHPVPPE
jgi:FAD/FMN-containing dehydrogenase